MACGFTIDHYVDTLVKARDKGYSIKPVCQYFNDKKVILLRHDVDYSISYAYDLANIEYDLGICSTYYIYFHSETYNALAPDSIKMIRAMREMGHEIGLHYDSRYYLAGERQLFDMHTCTQHHPSENRRIKLLQDPNDLPLKYISDSARNWREGCFCQWIDRVPKLHINIHPLWWLNGGVRDEVMHKVVQLAKNNLDIGRDNYLKTLRKYCEDLGIAY